MVTSLFVPARLLDVVVVKAPQQELSSLERLTLEAIHHGCRYAANLADLFGLGERLVLDLLSDLWQQGYIAIEFRSGELALSGAVTPRIVAGSTTDLKTTQTTESKVRVVQELLSGHVMTLKPWALVRPRSVVPIEVATSPPPIRHEELIAVVEDLIAKRESGQTAPPSEILNVTVIGADVPTATTWIEIDVEGFRAVEAEALALNVTGPTTIARPVRLEMERALRSLASAMPEHICFKQFDVPELDAHADSFRQSPAALFHQLAETVGELQRERIDVAALHETLKTASVSLGDQVRQAAASQVAVRPLRSAADQHAAIDAMLDSAERQVVIASPRLNYEALRRLEPRLRDAVMRGVRVFVLWGVDGDEKLSSQPPEVRHWVLDVAKALANAGGANGQTLPLFNVALASCRITGGFVAQDFQRLLIGSHAPLRVARPGEPIGSVVIEGLGDDNPWLLEILAWARRTFPDPMRGRLIGLPRGGTSTSVRLPSLPSSPVAALEAPAGSAVSPVSERLWKIGWQQHLAALSASWMAGEWSAEAAIDADHRTALLSALQRKGRALLILSRELKSDVVTGSFIRMLRETLQAGTRVIIGVGPNGPSGDDGDRCRALAEEFPGQMIVRASPVDAEIVADDDGMVVTSFPLLRRRGFFSQSKGKREPSSIGIVLRHPQFLALAGDLMSAWGIPASFWQDVASSRQASLPAALPLTDVPVADVEALAALLIADVLPRRRALHVREWFASRRAADAWATLDLLKRLGVSDEDLELTAACCLDVVHEPQEGEARSRWLRWLVSRLWSRGRFTDALLLSGEHDAPHRHTAASDGGVPAYLLRLGALRGTRAVVQDLIDLSLLGADRRDDERIALAAIATEALLVDGFGEAAECLQLLQPPPGVFADLAAASAAYWNAAAERLPVADLAAARQSRARDSRADAIHKEWSEAVEQVETQHFSFEPAAAAWPLLFTESSTFGRLVVAVRGKNARAASQWFEGRNVGPRQIDEMIDEVARKVMDQKQFYGDYRLVFPGKKRNLHAQRLLDVARLARKWAGVAGSGATDDGHPTEAELRLLPALEAGVRDPVRSGAPLGLAAPLLRALFDRLEPLFAAEGS